MCIENKDELTEDEKKEHIKKQIDKYDEKEIDDIIEACRNIKNIKDFAIEVALINNNYKHLRDDLNDEIKEREKSMREFKVNYVDRFNQLNTETKKNRSKIADVVAKLQLEIKKVDDKICNSISELSLKIETKVNEANQGLLKFMWIILSLVITAIIGGGIKFVMDWITS